MTPCGSSSSSPRAAAERPAKAETAGLERRMPTRTTPGQPSMPTWTPKRVRLEGPATPTRNARRPRYVSRPGASTAVDTARLPCRRARRTRPVPRATSARVFSATSTRANRARTASAGVHRTRIVRSAKGVAWTIIAWPRRARATRSARRTSRATESRARGRLARRTPIVRVRVSAIHRPGRAPAGLDPGPACRRRNEAGGPTPGWRAKAHEASVTDTPPSRRRPDRSGSQGRFHQRRSLSS